MTIWAFNSPASQDFNSESDRQTVLRKLGESVKHGKSRFGWSTDVSDDLRDVLNWEKARLQLFLLEVESGDWIVHINLPEWGRCLAVKVVDSYDFDDGIELLPGYRDFRHYFNVDVSTLVEFDRRDANVLPNVNLYPRYRFHRIYNEEDFHKTLENLKSGRVSLNFEQTAEEFHLKEANSAVLDSVTESIQQMHRGKNLETFIAKVIRETPGDIDVYENGRGWGTDEGADLIVTIASKLGRLQLEKKVVVQIKSYQGAQEGTEAVSQIENAINKFNADAGMIITTATSTENLENAINSASDEIGRPIDLLASRDVAKLAIKYAPHLVFDLDINT